MCAKPEFRYTAALVAFVSCVSSHAATFTVTTIADSGEGSLRQAILSANATATTPDLIHFAIPGAGPHTIAPLTPLPVMTAPATIDGYTQPGSSENTLSRGIDAVIRIEVLDTLIIDTTNSTVRGLALRQLQLGAVPGPKGGNTIQGNFIGVDATGTNVLGSQGSGIFIQTPSNIIGGGFVSARNLISGHGTTGMEIFEAFASGNLVHNNYIGTDRTGTRAIPNTDRALVVNQNAFGNTISDNVISGNLNRGITLDGFNNLVRGNLIGTDPTGTQPLGNARTGVEISGPGNTIGGTNVGAGNIIAFNGVDGGGVFTTNGIDVAPGTIGYAIYGNSIFDNAGLGIDINRDFEPTPGYVLLTQASNTTTTTVIRGKHTPGSFRLELFNNIVPDPSGFGEGRTLLASTNVTTDASGNFTLNWPVPIPPGLFITATANGTNEFSEARMVVAAGRTNSWITNFGGKWENGPSWSLGVAPYAGLTLVMITNAGTKTVTNDVTTAAGFPTTMTISNLLIAAPAGATNTLRLAHGGVQTPLTIRSDARVNSGGRLVLDNAAMILQGASGAGLKIDGSVQLSSGLLLVTNLSFGPQLFIGNNGQGELVVSNGTVISSYAIVGVNDGADGRWHIAGGSNLITTTFDIADSMTATGRVVVTDGSLALPGAYIGLFGNGQFVVSNGVVKSSGFALIGSQAGSQGALIAAGGTTAFGSMLIRESSEASGSLLVTGNAQVTVNGPLDNRGSVTVSGGRLAVLGQLDSEVPGNSIRVTGGQFIATNDNAFLTTVTVSNGAFLGRDIYLGNQKTGNFTVAGGTVALPGSFNGFNVGVNGGTGVVWQAGGEIILTNTDLNIGGLFSPAVGNMILSNGTTYALNAYVGGQGDGTGNVAIVGGTLIASNLQVNANSRLTFSRGSLQTREAAVANNLPFIVGDGADPAIYTLLGGTNAFSRSLRIMPNGLLTGSGTIQAPATNAGTIAPGAAIGRILLTGGLVLSNNSSLRFEIGGTTPGTQYDQLSVSGTIVQAGTVHVQLTNAFTPSVGQVFELVTALNRSGAFSAVNLPVLPAGLAWTNRLAIDGSIGVIAQPVPPQLFNPLVLGNGSLQFGFSNIANGSFTILATTNLALPMNSWTALGAPSQTSPGVYQFTDPEATIHLQRFYRVRSP